MQRKHTIPFSINKYVCVRVCVGWFSIRQRSVKVPNTTVLETVTVAMQHRPDWSTLESDGKSSSIELSIKCASSYTLDEIRHVPKWSYDTSWSWSILFSSKYGFWICAHSRYWLWKWLWPNLRAALQALLLGAVNPNSILETKALDSCSDDTWWTTLLVRGKKAS